MTELRPVGELCEAKTRGGTECARPAGWGTSHPGFGNCKLHSGSTPNGEKHALELRRRWEARLAEEIDPSLDRVVAIRDHSESDNVKLAAAKDLLDRAGVRVQESEGGGVRRIIFEWPD